MTLPSGSGPVLAVGNLAVDFRAGSGWAEVVNSVSFKVERGEVVGIVGESGSGKTVTGLSILGLLPARQARVRGSIELLGRELVGLPEADMQRVRGARVGMVFQEPMTALDPVFTVGEQIAETLLAHKRCSARQARERAVQALADVGIPSPHRRVDEYPHRFSGGMRQRVLIAIALACEPALLIADEPTTALDVTVQAQVVDLLLRLVGARGTSLLFISHNLAVVSRCCDRVITMYAGQLVENGGLDEVLEQPLHPYTSGLLQSMPSLAQPWDRLTSIGGRVPSARDMPTGCRFAPRCCHADGRCQEPQALQHRGSHSVRCIRQSELVLPGVAYA